MSRFSHNPVMLAEVVGALRPAAGEVFVDGTFGAGGYSRALLEAADCRVWAIDRDPTVADRARQMERDFPGRLIFVAGRFSAMDELLSQRGIDAVDGITLDVGVSSMQLDDPARGFSFSEDGPLDMRMERTGPSAADIVNRTAESDLADIIFTYGEERQSRRIARAIVAARVEAPITTTLQLAGIVAGAVRGASRIHPATRTFQALRIYVNNELSELEGGLVAAERLLAPRGRLAIVSFHSLEDRRVKRFLTRRSGAEARPSRHEPPTRNAGPAPSFFLPKRGTIKPTAGETEANPRARSARLRVAVRTDADAWPQDGET